MDLSPHHECSVSGAQTFVFRLSQIVGVAGVKFERVCNGWRMRASRARGLYGKTFFLTVFIILIIGLIKEYNLDPVHYIHFRTTSQVAATAIAVFALSSVLFTEVFLGMNRITKTISCLGKAQKITSELNHYGPAKSYETAKLLLTVWVLGAGAINSLAASSSQIYDVTKMTENHLPHGMYITIHFQGVMVKTLLIQLGLIHVSVLATFNHLNDCLKRLQLQIRNEDMVTISSKATPATIHRFGILYCNISDVVKQLSACNGLVLVTLLLSFLLTLIIRPHQILRRLFEGSDFLRILQQLSWMLIHVSDLLVIVEPCFRTQRQMVRSKYLISQLIKYTPPEYDSIMSELMVFYKHLKTNNIVYAPLNMFKINRTVITTIVSLITTYSVVVIQI